MLVKLRICLQRNIKTSCIMATKDDVTYLIDPAWCNDGLTQPGLMFVNSCHIWQCLERCPVLSLRAGQRVAVSLWRLGFGEILTALFSVSSRYWRPVCGLASGCRAPAQQPVQRQPPEPRNHLWATHLVSRMQNPKCLWVIFNLCWPDPLMGPHPCFTQQSWQNNRRSSSCWRGSLPVKRLFLPHQVMIKVVKWVQLIPCSL